MRAARAADAPLDLPHPHRRGANAAGLTLGTAVFAMFLMLTLYMQQVLTYSPMKTGVAYLAVAGTAIIWSSASTLVTRIGVKPVLVVGMTMLTAGLVYFTQVSVAGSYAADLLPVFSRSRSVWDSRSCRSRSPRWPVSVTPRPASPRGSSTRPAGGRRARRRRARDCCHLGTDAATADGSALPVALTNGFEAAFIVGAAIAFAGVLVGLFAVRREDLAQPEAEEATCWSRRSSSTRPHSGLSRRKVLHRHAVPAHAHHQLRLTVRPRCPGGSFREASVRAVVRAVFERAAIAAPDANTTSPAGYAPRATAERSVSGNGGRRNRR